MTKYDTGVKGSSSSANDSLANNVATLRAAMPTNNVVLAGDRESFSILGNVTEKSNTLSIGFDDITIFLYVAQPVLKFISLGIRISLDPTDLVPLLDFPISESTVLDFMNNQLQTIIQEARNEALDKRNDYYTFKLPSAARLDELAAIYGFDTVGNPKTFTNISLGYIS